MTIQRQSILLVCAVLLCAAAAVPAGAQDDGSFSGDVRVGYRSVDFSGQEFKFKEDLNYDDGPRLFELGFEFSPASDEMGGLVDRVYLDIYDFGGSPYETLSLGVQKFGAFDFRYDRRESDYFYHDTILPKALAGDPGLAFAGDFHTFDFRRVQESAKLSIDVTDRASVNFGFDRFTKLGESTTTLDISRDEFELDKPIDESLNAFQAGFEYAWDDVTLVLQERYRDYENVVEIFAPGFSLGETTDDATTLDFFFLDQPYDFTSNDHVAKIVATPGDRLTIRAQALLQRLDLDVEADEESQGTSFTGAPFTTDLSGNGEIERELDLFDVDVSYLVTDRVALVGGVYQRSLDQRGDFVFGGDLRLGGWEVETTGLEAGVEFSATSAVTLTGGVRWEDREVEHDAIEGAEPGEGLDLEEGTDTEHTGFFGILAYRPVGSPFDLVAEVDSSSYDDPFTLTSPTDRLRWKLRASYGLGAGFSLAGTYVANTSENDDANWEATYDKANLRLAYNADGLNASLGYSLIDIERDVDQTVVTLPGFGGGQELFFPILYEAESDIIDGRLRWKASESWILGGSFQLYENDGSFGIERDDLRVFADYLFPEGYTVGLAYRMVDYDEELVNFDDYDADIIEASIGYRW